MMILKVTPSPTFSQLFKSKNIFKGDFTRVKADSSNKKAKTETNKENDEKKTKKKTERY